MIRIMKASAGSGKTYNLARTYISLLLESPDRYAYRHVLAVTFTNKATAEMKSRILRELHTLAKDTESSDYYDFFVPEMFPDAGRLAQKAGRVLSDILHDYGAFSVSTIDKFFQATLRAFSREIGQFSSYQVELDKDALVKESVDRMLDSLTEDSKSLISWLNGSVMEQLSKGRRVNLERDLYEMAGRLKSEERRELSEVLGIDPQVTFSRENMGSIMEECSRVIADFVPEVREAASAVMDVMERAGVPLSETSRGFLSRIEEYASLNDGDEVRMPTNSFIANAQSPEKWFAKAKAPKYLPLVDTVLGEPLDRFLALFGEPFRVYSTALLLKESSSGLGIAVDFYNQFDALLKERNVLGIDDSNTLLRGIIDGSDAPFVYEKTGVRYEHFLLDEFQDTSGIQWQNFLPLMKESDSSGNANLVVGDVKQSIYRWRGSDWKLLEEILPGQFPLAESTSLRENWRSCRNIVDFNGAFFGFAAGACGLGSLYSDVEQKVRCKDGQEGYVRVDFMPKEDELQAVLDSVMETAERGAMFGDIAVLVRTNAEGGRVASFLMDNGVPVISDDSLSLKSSVAVRRLVSLLSCVENPSDSVSSYLASSSDIDVPEKYHSLTDLCESLLRSMKEKDGDIFEGETLYIQSFMDFMQDWTSVNGNSLMHFLAKWNEGNVPYLSSPSDRDSVRIMTVHKSKGLEFPHVIFPFADSVRFYKEDWHWCRPAPSPLLPVSSDAIFPVRLKESSSSTLFSDDLEKEKLLQKVDNINTFYVALTRAGKSMHVISQTPPDSFLKGGSPKNFSQLLHSFVTSFPKMKKNTEAAEDCESFVLGEPYDFSSMASGKEEGELDFPASWYSCPIGDRLRLNADASDFFSADGAVGTGASRRLNGIVIHDILAGVEYPSDLGKMVDLAVLDGRLSAEEGEAHRAFLEARIASGARRGWFPDSDARILNEVTVFDPDGREHRPDRVVAYPGRTIVIDYKSGEKSDRYRYQLGRYVKLFRQMGYPSVTGHVWYLEDDSVEDVF